MPSDLKSTNPDEESQNSGESSKATNLQLNRPTVIGLSCGIFVAVCCIVYSHFMWSQASQSDQYPNSKRDLNTECEERGLIAVNDISCRPPSSIDFYLIKDYSLSGNPTKFLAVSEVIRRYFRSSHDRIACLGFGESLLPPSKIPGPTMDEGCDQRLAQLEEWRTSDRSKFETTDFAELFDTVRTRLAEERRRRLPTSPGGTENHRDLVIIFSDGLHDPDNRPFDCKKDKAEPLPQPVVDALESLNEDLASHADEVWMFMVLVSPPGDCANVALEIEKHWQDLYDHRLNTIRVGKESDPRDIARQIFESLNRSTIELVPEVSLAPKAMRTTFDQEGRLRARFSIERPALNTASVIRKDRLEITRSFLVDIDDKSEIELVHQDSAREASRRDSQTVDCSNDYAELLFRLDPAAPQVDPTRAYELHVELEGNANVTPLSLHPHPFSTARRHISDCTKFGSVCFLMIAAFFFIRSVVRSDDRSDPAVALNSVKERPTITVLGNALLGMMAVLVFLITKPELESELLAAALSGLVAVFARAAFQGLLGVFASLWAVLSLLS